MNTVKKCLAIGLGLGAALYVGADAVRQPLAGQAAAPTDQRQPAPGRGAPTGGQMPATQRGRGGGFTEPSPMDFNDHRGYMRLFDGVSLKGWDGNPKFWRVEDRAIVGESTPTNPSGNSYIVYRDLEAKALGLVSDRTRDTKAAALIVRART